jgi:lysine 2,3-aminomutase
MNLAVKHSPEQVRDLIKKYRVKVSPHLGHLMKRSDAVAKQFLPDPREKLDFGTERPFEEGKNYRGVYGLERIYEDRAVITPYFECGAYCRYCFKKTRTLAGEAKMMSDEDIQKAALIIRNDSKIKTVLITGGDPLMDIPLLKKVLDAVRDIPHVNNIRVGTRNILFRPQQITAEVADMLASYSQINAENLSLSKVLSVGLSINHADELTPEVVKATRLLIERGISVRGQVTLLKDINDTEKDILNVLLAFSQIGIIPYYLFHCMPVVGSHHFRTSVKRGEEILQKISPLSGAIALHYVYVTPIGKHRVGALKYDNVTIDGENYLKAKTPYKAVDYFRYSGTTTLPPLHGISEDGYIVSHYLDGVDEK